MIQRIASGIIALAYVVSAYFAAGPETAFRFAMILVIPLGCIWFSEAMGDYTGFGMGRPIRGASPGCLVAFVGWAVLATPAALLVYWAVR